MKEIERIALGDLALMPREVVPVLPVSR